jgi:DNA-binding transcriptional ArsR family regulator
MEGWSFLTNHARVLACIAHDPGLRLRDIAAKVGITERSAHGIVTDLTDAGYVLKERQGRRNRYQILGHLPLREPIGRELTIGEVLDLLVHAGPVGRDGRRRRPGRTALPDGRSAQKKSEVLR